MCLIVSGVSDLPQVRRCPQLSQVGCRSLVLVAVALGAGWDDRYKELLPLPSVPCCAAGIQARGGGWL